MKIVTEFNYSRAILVLLILITIFLALLRTSTTLVSYPFLFPDSFDWLVNGMSYSGLAKPDFAISHRGLPYTFLISLFYKLSCVEFTPAVGVIFHLCCSLLILYLPTGQTLQKYRPLASVLYFFNTCTMGQSAFIGSDVMANFFISTAILSIYTVVEKKDVRFCYLAAICSALAIHCQYIFIIFIPTIIITILICSYFYRENINELRRVSLIKHIQLSFILLAIIAILLLAPRFFKFGLLYAQGVQHVSLISFSLQNLNFYFIGLLASYSIPIVMFLILGIYFALSKREFRALSLVLIAWIVNGLIFFTFIYSWADVRFLIYISIPIMILASLGLVTLISLIKYKIIKLFVVFVAVLYTSSSPNSDPFDLTVSITPWHAINGSLTNLIRINSRPYLWWHLKQTLTNYNTQDANQSFMSDQAAYDSLVFIRQKYKNSINQPPVVWFENLDDASYYIVSNRNRFYFSGDVITTYSNQKLNEVLSTNTAVVLISKLYEKNLPEAVLAINCLEGNKYCLRIVDRKFP